MHKFQSKKFLVFLTISFMTNSVIAFNYVYEIIDDLPNEENFEYYLRTLEKAIDFCTNHKSFVDLDLQLGLFMADVNLRIFLKESISKDTRSRLEAIFAKNDELNENFYSRLSRRLESQEMEETDQKLLHLFDEVSTWLRPDKFSTELLSKTIFYTGNQLEAIYGKYDDYFKKVFDYDNNEPSPEKSDECMSELSGRDGLKKSWRNCVTSRSCRNMIKKGGDFGYGLTHRILHMIIARFSLKCFVFDKTQDRNLVEKLCMKAFNELRYIAKNNFQLLDLMGEQMSVCGLFGHAQFFRNYWLHTMLKFQTPEGCFLVKHATSINEDRRHKTQADEIVLNDRCDAHFTSVAIGAVSNALRYILETTTHSNNGTKKKHLRYGRMEWNLE